MDTEKCLGGWLNIAFEKDLDYIHRIHSSGFSQCFSLILMVRKPSKIVYLPRLFCEVFLQIGLSVFFLTVSISTLIADYGPVVWDHYAVKQNIINGLSVVAIFFGFALLFLNLKFYHQLLKQIQTLTGDDVKLNILINDARMNFGAVFFKSILLLYYLIANLVFGHQMLVIYSLIGNIVFKSVLSYRCFLEAINYRALYSIEEFEMVQF